MLQEYFKNLKTDKELYYAWQSNIAVAFQDAYHWYKKKNKKVPAKKDIHEISNTAAKHFLDILCKDTTETSDNSGYTKCSCGKKANNHLCDKCLDNKISNTFC